MNISYSINIKSTPERVFHWLSDPDRAKMWMTGVVEYEILNKTSDMVGTTFREIIEENGKRVEMQGKVTGFKINQELAFFLHSDFHEVDVNFYLEKAAGSTRLTQVSDIRFHGLMKILVIFTGPFLKKKIYGQLKHDFATLKKLCEKDESEQPD